MSNKLFMLLQIRAHNLYVPGKWSDAIKINLSGKFS